MTGSKAVGSGVAAANDDHALASGQNFLYLEQVPQASPVLLGQEFHRKMDASQIPARHFQITRQLRAACKNNGLKLPPQAFDCQVSADVRIRDELNPLGGHLLKTPVQDVLLQL